jgi:hypothetical protein
MVIGREDMVFLPSDSPLSIDDVATEPPSDIAPYLHEQWRENMFENMNDTWASLMNSELLLVDTLATIGDLLWPTVPILVWIFALFEGYNLYKDIDKDPMKTITNYTSRFTNPILNSISESGIYEIPEKISTKIKSISKTNSKLNLKMDRNLLFVLIPFIFVTSEILLKFV